MVQIGLREPLTDEERTTALNQLVALREAKKTLLDQLGRIEATIIADMQTTGATSIPLGDGKAVKLKQERAYDVSRVITMRELVPENVLPLVNQAVIEHGQCLTCKGSGERPPYVDGRVMLTLKRAGGDVAEMVKDAELPGVPRLLIE